MKLFKPEEMQHLPKVLLILDLIRVLLIRGLLPFSYQWFSSLASNFIILFNLERIRLFLKFQIIGIPVPISPTIFSTIIKAIL